MDTHRWQNNPFPIDFQGRIPVEVAVRLAAAGKSPWKDMWEKRGVRAPAARFR
jgi:hypothetical protein